MAILSLGTDPYAKREFLGFSIGRKCAHKNFNTLRNCVKLRDLAFENFGRKC